jgi:outer membrane biosynthesis protein TonB
MEFGKESLYGWGVCQVSMPRARNDIYADRRCAQKSVAFPDRRTHRLLRPFAVIFATILREDFPAMQTVLVVLAASLMLLVFGLVTLPVPPLVETPVPEPIEIVTRMLQEPLIEPPPVAAPLRKAQPEPPPVIVKPPVQPRPVVKKVPPQPKMLSLPPARVLPEPRPAPQKIVRTVEKPMPIPRKTLALAVPVRQSAVLKTPAPSRQASQYTVATTSQPRLVAERPLLGRRSRENLVVSPKASPVVDYSLKPSASGQQALVQGKQFAPTAPGTTVDLPTTSRSRSDFSLPRSQGGHAVARAGRSLAPEPGQSPVEIAAVGQVGGSYATSGAQAEAPLVSGEIGDFSGPAATVSVELPAASGQGAAAVSSSTESAIGSGPPDSAVHFVGDGEASGDPNLFVSLNQLAACVDQSEEDRLRTELAIRLDSNIVYPCGQMKFDIRNVETGQTVWMRIYNPLNFADRCAALRSAIECIDHSK